MRSLALSRLAPIDVASNAKTTRTVDHRYVIQCESIVEY